MRFSTAGLPSDSGKEIIRQFGDIGIKDLELSNFPKTYDLKKLCESKKYLDFSFQLHNYYMQEDKDEEFVMNLASLDDISAQKTIDKIENALSITSKLNVNNFCFHAGFFLDLSKDELGNDFSSTLYSASERTLAEGLFYKRLEYLAKKANFLNIKLGVETNVCTQKNLNFFQNTNPFMLANNYQISKFIERKPKNVGILWDFGHVKVSSNTFNFCPKKAFKDTKNHIIGLHLSDNDGKNDQNKAINRENWAIKEMMDFDNVTFEIYGKNMILKQLYELGKLTKKIT
jgi:sugar phosphate isomerase/epimerase